MGGELAKVLLTVRHFIFLFIISTFSTITLFMIQAKKCRKNAFLQSNENSVFKKIFGLHLIVYKLYFRLVQSVQVLQVNMKPFL